MSFLNSNDSEYLSARITNIGRQKIAQGNFVITNFQIGDSEFDYIFSFLDGTGVVPSQKVFSPLDKDSTVKYPYKLSSSTVSGTTFGNPIQLSQVETITNVLGSAGFVSEYFPFVESPASGSTIVCNHAEIDLASLDGSTNIIVPTGFTGTGSDYITIAFTRFVTEDAIISGASASLVYRIVNVITGSTFNQITVDRQTPNLSPYFAGITGSVISNKCIPAFPGPYNTDLTCLPNPPLPGSQQDPWTLELVWSEKPAGMDVAAVNESLSGYSSNVFVSTKEYLGYNSSSGQTSNTGTTITNSFGDVIIVYPEEQHSLAILHYSELNTDIEPDKFFKYEDYISGDTTLYNYNGSEITDTSYFEVYIPFIYYHRNSNVTIGARFFMDTTDFYVNSSAMDTKLQQLSYRYLIDEQNNRVGKVFTGKKVIVFDDQEIVAALDYKSNRRYTLPIPKVTQVSTDVKCSPTGILELPLMSGTTGQTLFVTYLFQYSNDEFFGGMHCNYYSKITGTSLNADVSVNFDSSDFVFMKNSINGYLNGYMADTFKIIAQLVDTGDQPSADSWVIMDFTSEIPNHTVSDIIDPVNMRGSRYIITNADYEGGVRYDIEDYLGNFPLEPSPFTPDFGDEEPFAGSVKLVRASDLQVMRFLVNLPDGEFTTSQNPSYSSGKNNVITEVALLDSNKDILVIAKTPRPLIRTGTQVFAVKIDL